MYKLGQSDSLTGQPMCIWLQGANMSIPLDPANTDYQAYLKWLEEGNEVLPPDEPENG